MPMAVPITIVTTIATAPTRSEMRAP